ncbi:MAG: PAS domain S-box protein [Desulfomonilaceae bacterium]|nr:PAS domain S-box protein [Desulfomonilaceae bacterium]
MHEIKRLKARVDEIETLLEISERKADILTNLLKEANAEFERALDLVTRTERNFRAVFENAPEAIYIIDAETRKILDCNPFTVTWLGYSREELLSMKVDDIVESRGDDVRVNIRKAVDFGIVRVQERKYVKKDGTVVDTEVTGTPVEYGGRPCVAILVRDITERKQLEEFSRYKELFESVSDPVFINDYQGNLLEVNEGACQLTEYARDQLLHMPIRHLVRPDQLQIVADVLDDVRRGETVQFELDFMNRRGQPIPFEFRSRCITYHGRPAALSVARDLSIRRKLEETLIRTERLTAVGEMATGVAHNFNNLLQMIMGAAQAALSRLDSGKIGKCREPIVTILRSCDRGTDIVRRIRDFTHGGREETLEARGFNVGEVVKEAVELTKPLWENLPDTPNYDVRVDGFGESFVYGRPSEIYEVLVNLIKNAFDAMPEGGALNVSSYSDDGKVYLTVSDTGQGIPKENLQRVFEPFFTTKGSKSSGLGLSSSYGLVKKHHGDIMVESSVGKGTTFTVVLPAATRPDAAPDEAGVIGAHRNIKLLLIDDEINILKSMEMYFEDGEMEVVTALGGAAGLQEFFRGRFDAILCDMSMDGMNGLEIAEGVKQYCEEHNIPKPAFLIHTGWYERIDPQELEEKGVDRVVTKPVRYEEILQIIRQAVS